MVFESESYSIQEDGGSVSVCVRTNGMITEAFSIIVATTNLSPVDAMGRLYMASIMRGLTITMILCTDRW